MNKYLLLFITISLLFYSSVTLAEPQKVEILVIKNISNPAQALTKNQLRNIFLGRNNYSFEPVIPPVKTISRMVFNTKIIGLNESRIQSYYAQMRFSGRARPPKELKTVNDLIQYVVTHPKAITYVPKDTQLPEGIEIIYTINM